MPNARTLTALTALAVLASSCTSLIPDQQKDYLNLSKKSLSGTLTPSASSQALAPQVSSSTWSGTLTYQGTFGDISGLSVDPTNFSINLGFATGTLSAACGSSSGISLKVNTWSVKVTDPANPGGVTRSSSTPLTYSVTASGTSLTLVASGPGTGMVSGAFGDLKPIVAGGGDNTVTASAQVVLSGCTLDAPNVTMTLTTPDLQQTLSFK